ncbi:MAG: winged helix-turn-helix transcriptional regulator [Alphaproteobacteria bacterium]|nr:winged helix-turn-helix transcriptional regulator [Alphaproteobacteria bacterium]
MTIDTRELERNIQQAAALLRSLSSEKRLMVMCALHKGEKSVTELREIVDISQSALSQHLAKLRKEGMVATRRDAQTIYYSISHPSVDTLLHCLCRIYAPCKTE